MPYVAAYVIDYAASSNQPWKAEIRCWSNAQTAEYPVTATVRFYPGSSIPASGHVGGIVVLNYPLSKFADVVSIFRDEEHLIVDTIAYDSAGQTVSGWSISGGPGLAGEMKP